MHGERSGACHLWGMPKRELQRLAHRMPFITPRRLLNYADEELRQDAQRCKEEDCLLHGGAPAMQRCSVAESCSTMRLPACTAD